MPRSLHCPCTSYCVMKRFSFSEAQWVGMLGNKQNANQILNHAKQYRADTKYEDDSAVHMNSSSAGCRCH